MGYRLGPAMFALQVAGDRHLPVHVARGVTENVAGIVGLLDQLCLQTHVQKEWDDTISEPSCFRLENTRSKGIRHG